MPPPALKGAHKAALPRAPGGPPRADGGGGARPNLSLGAAGEVTPRRLQRERCRPAAPGSAQQGLAVALFFFPISERGLARWPDWSSHLFGACLHGSDEKPQSGLQILALSKRIKVLLFSSPAGLVAMRRTFTLDARTACPAEAPRLIDI